MRGLASAERASDGRHRSGDLCATRCAAGPARAQRSCFTAWEIRWRGGRRSSVRSRASSRSTSSTSPVTGSPETAELAPADAGRCGRPVRPAAARPGAGGTFAGWLARVAAHVVGRGAPLGDRARQSRRRDTLAGAVGPVPRARLRARPGGSGAVSQIGLPSAPDSAPSFPGEVVRAMSAPACSGISRRSPSLISSTRPSWPR